MSPDVARPRPPSLERRIARRMSQPISIARAAWVIVLATAGVVVASGIAMWAFDHSEYPDIGRGIWWALQTVTTVGYGDVTPQNVSGRIVAGLVMLWAIAFVAVLVAAITSAFISGVQRRLAAAEAAEEESAERRIEARFDSLDARLDRLEQLLAARGRHNP
jgi:voltage-gated potassium channel